MDAGTHPATDAARIGQLTAIIGKWRADGIAYVRFEAPDQMGNSRSKLVPIGQALGYATDGLNMYGGSLVLDTRSDVVPSTKYHEEINYADQLLFPDPSTAAVVPWADRTARFVCESRWYDGSRMAGAPRNVLASVLDRYEALGYRAFMGQENEFYVLDPVTREPALFGGYHIFNTNRNEYHPFVRELIDGIDAMGIEIITANCEYGPSQWEINYGPKIGLAAADATFTFKNAVKELCRNHGLLATFMSKPSASMAGCGAHTHVSLLDADGNNAMADANSSTGLSDLALHFIGGNLVHCAAIDSLLAPTVNCLRRRRPHTFSPTRVGWGIEDRTAPVRVKLGSLKSRHVEQRVASGLSNPYLAMAAVLAAGLVGIEQRIDPGAPSTFGAPVESVETNPMLPLSLRDSLAALDQSSDMRRILGDEFVDIYLTVRRYELARFDDHVTDWERNEYAELY
jgi:glutamine synthetase